jgi:hypothetical protein
LGFRPGIPFLAPFDFGLAFGQGLSETIFDFHSFFLLS